jgi:hypothetical protein
MELRRDMAPYAPYERLGAWLAAQPGERVPLTLTFAEVEQVLGHRLPPSAWCSSSWWQHAEQRQQAPGRAWRAAGWQLEAVDHQDAVVTFTRIGDGQRYRS